MFTGIVEHRGKVVERQALAQGVRLEIATHFDKITSGESVSVDGVCLTAIRESGPSPAGSILGVEISPETLSKSTLGDAVVGTELNLEKALRMGDSMGGHWVTGHVDTTAEVRETREQGPFLRVVFAGLSAASVRWLIPKGSVTVSGVSLTVNEVYTDGFSVMLIPHTLEKTGLKTLVKSSKVNIEFDWMIKTVLRDLGSRLTWIEEANAEFRPH